jgi:hypothetical protein
VVTITVFCLLGAARARGREYAKLWDSGVGLIGRGPFQAFFLPSNTSTLFSCLFPIKGNFSSGTSIQQDEYQTNTLEVILYISIATFKRFVTISATV